MSRQWIFRTAMVLSVPLLLKTAFAAERPVGDFFVSPRGNDGWSGTLPEPDAAGTDGPLATLQAARDAVRRLKAHGPVGRPVRVVIRGGTYRVDEPIVFSPEDSGTPKAPVVYATWPGEEPVVSGGLRVTGWQKGEGPVWTAKLPAVKTNAGGLRQMFVDGRRATPARGPNVETFRSAGPGVPYPKRKEGRRDPNIRISFYYQDEDLNQWRDLDEAVLVVYHSWTTSRHRVKSLDTARRLVTFTAPSGWPLGWWEKDQRYYVECVRQALDAPGEWYLDRTSGTLSYYPREGEDMTSAEVIVPVAEELLRLDGEAAAGRPVEHLQFDGLSFEHTDWIMPAAETVDGQAAAFLATAAVRANGARHCLFQRCRIARTGGYALWLEAGCKENRVQQCHIHDLGAGGVRIGQTSLPDEERLQTERNDVNNCFIHDGGKVYHAGVGVWIGKSSHNTIQHNDICDFFYTGVSVGWSWGYAPTSAHHNAVEYNHIHHLGWGQLSDMGGIYCLGVSPGTRLRYNLIHDVLAYSYGGWGLYTDEGSTEILMENNVVYRVKDGAFHQHYGRDNIVRNNVLALSATYGQIRRSREEEHNSFTLERNIIYGDGVQPLGGNWKNGNYRLDYNCYWNASGQPPAFPGGRSLAEWQKTGQDTHSIIADPKFVDPGRFNFCLQPDSPTIKLGFQPIDIAPAGLVGPSEWVDLPEQIDRPEMPMPVQE